MQGLSFLGLDWTPFYLTLKLALVATVALYGVGLPLAYGILNSRGWVRLPLQALVNMPLVLPPTVIGFYLLVFFSPDHFPGSFLREGLGISLIFSFGGLVIGSMVCGLPFMINPLISGLENLPRSLGDGSLALGATRWQTYWRVQVPNIRPSILAAGVLTAAHTIGEFGVVLMIGGKIPGLTKVASMAVYDEVEALNFGAAHVYAAALCLLSFGAFLGLFLLNSRSRHPF